jgi:hypothetical protein
MPKIWAILTHAGKKASGFFPDSMIYSLKIYGEGGEMDGTVRRDDGDDVDTLLLSQRGLVRPPLRHLQHEGEGGPVCRHAGVRGATIGGY